MSTQEIQPFKYQKDITSTFGTKTQTIGEMLEMSDKEYSALYEEYEKQMGKQFKELEGPASGLALIGLTGVVDLMERVRLERRINKLDKH